MKLTRVVCTALACLGFGLASCNQAPATPERKVEPTMVEFVKAALEVENPKLGEDYLAEENGFFTGLYSYYAEPAENEDALYWQLVAVTYEMGVYFPSYMSFVEEVQVGTIEEIGMVSLGELVSDDKKVSAEVFTYSMYLEEAEADVIVSEVYVMPYEAPQA